MPHGIKRDMTNTVTNGIRWVRPTERRERNYVIWETECVSCGDKQFRSVSRASSKWVGCHFCSIDKRRTVKLSTANEMLRRWAEGESPSKLAAELDITRQRLFQVFNESLSQSDVDARLTQLTHEQLLTIVMAATPAIRRRLFIAENGKQKESNVQLATSEGEAA